MLPAMLIFFLMNSDCLHFINGRYVPSRSGMSFENLNPDTGEVHAADLLRGQ
jgi:hypothetical protein